MADNDEASGSRAGGGENLWLSMLATGGNLEMHDADNEMEEPHRQEAPDTSGGDEGNETTTSGIGDGTSGSEAKRQRKARRPNKLGTVDKPLHMLTPKAVFLPIRRNMQEGTATS